ncbi:MAG: AmmeMemoRadiSam system radical SAM enzyme [bacterium]
MTTSLYFEKLENQRVRCTLCPHECVIAQGKAGICRGRVNRQGRLYAENYGQVSSLALDPVEKKPLYHFFPGSSILSIGVSGCNLRCQFCQNWQLSQTPNPSRYISPEKLAALAGEHNSIGVAFTYSEPLIWYEYIRDCAPLLRRAGLKTVLVSNGFLNEEPFKKILPHIDAFNIDLKSIEGDFYKGWCGGRLEPVLENIRSVDRSDCHLELTNLIIPGLNDSDEQICALVDWVAGLNPDIPVHFSRYHPDYQCTQPPTPAATMRRALSIAQGKLKYVYLGNMSEEDS